MKRTSKSLLRRLHPRLAHWLGETFSDFTDAQLRCVPSILEQYERDHPLPQEAYRQAMHIFLDAETAYAFLVQVQDFVWKLRELPVVSPFSFPIYASKIKESMMLENPAAAIERIYFEMYSRVEQVAAENPKGRAR